MIALTPGGLRGSRGSPLDRRQSVSVHIDADVDPNGRGGVDCDGRTLARLGYAAGAGGTARGAPLRAHHPWSLSTWRSATT